MLEKFGFGIGIELEVRNEEERMGVMISELGCGDQNVEDVVGLLCVI